MKRIIVPVDFSDAVPKVLDTACEMAQASNAEIILLHIADPEPGFVGYEPGPASVRAAVAREFVRERQEIEKLEMPFRNRGIPVRALVIQGVPAEKIVAEARKMNADAIVMGSHGHGLLHQLLVGSTTEGVIRHASCPVTVVPVRK